MKIKIILFITLIVRIASAGVFPDFGYLPPTSWDGEVFELSQDYPSSLPEVSIKDLPWTEINPELEPKKYLQAVLEYAFEGNESIDFIVKHNPVRKWYHVPWLHWGLKAYSGRDFIKGLTQERISRSYELSAQQSYSYKNYAIGFYNELGGYTIGRCWEDPDNPNPKKAQFPEGTVSFKLLFTTAPVSEVDFLQGSPEWNADVYRLEFPNQIKKTKVRLLQIDVAVKDKRSKAGGWILGSFQYDASVREKSPWRRVVPLTLMWGNDPTLKPSDYDSGKRPQESWINLDAPVVKYRLSQPMGGEVPRTLGWAGRGNGPIDNFISSCISCHSTAQIPAKSNMIPPSKLSEDEKLRWFRNLAPYESFDSGTHNMDMSLQLALSIQNFQNFKVYAKNYGGFYYDHLPTSDNSTIKNNIQEYRFHRGH